MGYVVQLPRSIGEDLPFDVRIWHGFVSGGRHLGVVEILVVNSTLDFEHVGFIVAQFWFPLYTFVSLNLFCLGLSEALEHSLQFC